MPRIAIGTMVHNEARNLDRLLTRLTGAQVPGSVVDPIVVVSSGSTDQSEEIVRRHAALDPRIRLVLEERRNGKAMAIQRFLEVLPPEVELCVMVSADVVPDPDAIALLVAPLSDPDVGMAGAHPIPTNPSDGWTNRVVHFHWELHDRVARVHPKLGEMVAFRRISRFPDTGTWVDEATLEAWMASHDLRLAYVPEARLRNRGPDSVAEFISQRRRHWAGHLRLRRQTGYRVSTYRLLGLWQPLLDQLRQHPDHLPVAVWAALLEGVARSLGTLDHLVLDRNSALWPMLSSTKEPLGPPDGHP